MKEYFDILGLNEGASQEEIQEAYDRLMKELDPEKNNNQEFFVEEYEKIQEAYSVLKNSTILSNGVKIKEKISNSNKYVDNSDITNGNILDSKKMDFSNLFSKNKKKIISFILLTFFFKVLVHFFIFPTEKTILNTDKKVFVQVSNYGDILKIRRGIGKIDNKGNKLIVFGDNYFYYPKEQKKLSIEEHITMIFKEKQWIFPCIIILMLFIVWINQDSVKVDKSDSKKKSKFSSYLSKINLIIFSIVGLIAYNLFLQNQVDSLSKSINTSTDSSQETANNLNVNSKKISSETENHLYTSEEYMNTTEEYMSSAQEYMNITEEYMNNAEEYMNNAARSAQEAEGYANGK
ncbi:MAG: DnaJ domain [Bacteroidota bacterium]|jgi:methyl-accepting chemotaxis protein